MAHSSLKTKRVKSVKIFHPIAKLALIPLLLLSNQAISGAWVPEKGQGYVKGAIQYFEADDFFGQADLDEFTGTNTSFYGEYGLGNNWAIYGSALNQDIEQISNTNEIIDSSGLGDIEVGVRYQWQAEPFVLSTSFLVKLPYLYDENDPLPRGNGQEDFEARVLIGKSLWPHNGYIGVEFGYRYRTDTPSDEFRYLIEYGYSFNDNAYFRTKLDGIASVKNADTIDQGNGNLSLGPEFDLAKLELTYGWNFGNKRPREEGRLGAEVTYVYDLYGDNTLQGQALQFGITWTF